MKRCQTLWKLCLGPAQVAAYKEDAIVLTQLLTPPQCSLSLIIWWGVHAPVLGPAKDPASALPPRRLLL